MAPICAATYPKLVGALAHHTGGVLLAEEVAQEALLRACDPWQQAGRVLPTGGSLGATDGPNPRVGERTW